jgi:hypothetical protein
MFVPCPHCQFLVAHHPQLRPLPAQCPRCGRRLQEDVDALAIDADGTGDGQPQDNAASSGLAATAAGDPVDDAAVDADGSADRQAIATATAAPAAATFAARAPRDGWARWQWPLIALLTLLLALQVLLADRANIAADPRWRPLVETLCGALGCDLPPWREPSAFTMLDRKVRPEPRLAGALRVDATFRNDARWPQAWPALQLALSDADGRVLGSRVFQPAEYLGATPGTLLSPGQSAQITFLVQEPSPGTVAFSFEFR